MSGREYLTIWAFSIGGGGICAGLVYGGEALWGDAGAIGAAAIFLGSFAAGLWIFLEKT